MESRLELIRGYVDNVLLNMSDDVERRAGYLHLYGVSQACAMIAIKRNENVELAMISGMLHDIYSYSTMDTVEHAHKGASMAKDILESLEIFSDEEKSVVCQAIYNHSDKEKVDHSFDEVLKDADAMQHYLYNPLIKISDKEKHRIENLRQEFCF